MAGAGAGAGQGFPGAEDPEAAARTQQLESELAVARRLREGLEKQAEPQPRGEASAHFTSLAAKATDNYLISLIRDRGSGVLSAADRRIKQLEADLEVERGLRKGLEKQVAAFRKRMTDMGQEQAVKGVEDLLSVSVKAVARNIRSYSAAQMTALPDDLRERVLDELILAES